MKTPTFGVQGARLSATNRRPTRALLLSSVALLSVSGAIGDALARGGGRPSCVGPVGVTVAHARTVRGDALELRAGRSRYFSGAGCLSVHDLNGWDTTAYPLPLPPRALVGDYLTQCAPREVVVALAAGSAIKWVRLMAGHRTLALLRRYRARRGSGIRGHFFIGSTAGLPSRVLGKTRDGKSVAIRVLPGMNPINCSSSGFLGAAGIGAGI